MTTLAATTTPTTPTTPTAPAAEPSEATLAEQRIVLRGVSWETYLKLSQEMGDKRGLKSYNRGVLELMAPELIHEDYRNLLDCLIRVVTDELTVPCRGLGSTTWNDPEAERGLEADKCYFLTAAKVAEFARNRAQKAAHAPRPDLAVEIDISRPKVDRTEIYATLGIVEVWRFDGKTLRIDQLRDDGTYETIAASRFLRIPPSEIVRWVVDELVEDDNAWMRRLRAWVRAELVGRPE